MDEPTYEDVDDEGNSLSPRAKRPRWQTDPVAEPALLQECFALYGRVRFAEPDEAKRWKQIAREVGNGKMPREWVRDRIQVAREMIGHGNYVRFWTLEGMILNVEKMKDWMARNKIYQDTAIRQEHKDGPIRKA